MLKEYEVNQTRRWDLAKKQIKRHPKWNKRKWVRWTLLTLCIAAPIVGVSFALTNPGIVFRELDGSVANIDIILNICFSVLVFSMFPGMVTLPYFASLRGTCFDESNYKLQETLCLTDEGIQNIYHPLDASESNYAIQAIVPYHGITKLVYNNYHERLQVFGEQQVTRYLNYERNVVDYKVVHQPNEGYSRRFYAYYENFEDFMNTVSEKSGLPIEHINYPEE
jgi:hypothetical protein